MILDQYNSIDYSVSELKLEMMVEESKILQSIISSDMSELLYSKDNELVTEEVLIAGLVILIGALITLVLKLFNKMADVIDEVNGQTSSSSNSNDAEKLEQIKKLYSRDSVNTKKVKRSKFDGSVEAEIQQFKTGKFTMDGFEKDSDTIMSLCNIPINKDSTDKLKEGLETLKEINEKRKDVDASDYIESNILSTTITKFGKNEYDRIYDYAKDLYDTNIELVKITDSFGKKISSDKAKILSSLNSSKSILQKEGDSAEVYIHVAKLYISELEKAIKIYSLQLEIYAKTLGMIKKSLYNLDSTISKFIKKCD